MCVVIVQRIFQMNFGTTKFISSQQYFTDIWNTNWLEVTNWLPLKMGGVEFVTTNAQMQPLVRVTFELHTNEGLSHNKKGEGTLFNVGSCFSYETSISGIRRCALLIQRNNVNATQPLGSLSFLICTLHTLTTQPKFPHLRVKAFKNLKAFPLCFSPADKKIFWKFKMISAQHSSNHGKN